MMWAVLALVVVVLFLKPITMGIATAITATAPEVEARQRAISSGDYATADFALKELQRKRQSLATWIAIGVVALVASVVIVAVKII